MVFIVAGTMLFALSIVGMIGSRSKSRTMLLVVRLLFVELK